MIGNNWDKRINWDAFADVLAKAEAAYAAETVYPAKENLFRAFQLTPPEAVKAVILGQDPYHEPNQAHGLAFSVQKGVALPPSLRNIYTELADDLGVTRTDGDLTDWAQEGVLLLNTVLTVEHGKANSHKNLGWQAFTDDVIAAIGAIEHPVAFVLWGGQAQKKAALAANSAYPRLILQAPHPSPLSVYRGFYGSKPFSQINDFLTKNGQTPIRWAP